ncbi:hypothetical protein BSL78_03931 [Apostichopus japonicus]|uniref:Calponin-homology (CH) domain-containing protein n=1 Tax=Stichopus japonicus TaxID=307972 RepID=A0A2G8LFV3_STIJA|nr:hypothetical protein BSL78_03931 [Apostichopus japonicus]
MLPYTLNGHHTGHLIVYADVGLVALELSSDVMNLSATPGLPAEAGLRDVIMLKNKRNYPAEFTWQPVLGERGTAFSIRPAAGIVEAFQDLECEVVFHPSYHAPEDGEFVVQVNGGEHLKLRCHADLGPTQVMFMERRVLFGQVPLHLTTSRTALLHNHSQNHAFFQVVDPNPVPGLTVFPVQGVVPVGGTTELQVYLTPSAVMKFDTRLEVDIRGWRTIELRMGGTVEPPVVDIDVSSFHFGGIYCGSSITLPFKLINKGKTKAKVVFDLSRFRDFTLKFDADVMEESEDSLHPGTFKATIQGLSTMKCQLEFTPTEVASYDFIVPVNINQTEAPTPDPTPLPPTPAPSYKSIHHIIAPRPINVTVATPKRRIVATALRQPLEMSHHNLDFTLPSGFLRLETTGTKAQCKATLLINNSGKVLNWSLDSKGCGTAVEEGVFQFISSRGVPFLSPREGGTNVEDMLEPGQTYDLGVNFCPTTPGEYSAKVPIILNGNIERPYQYLHLYGVLHAPKLTFDPLAIVMTPVPLSTSTSTDLTIYAHGFTSKSVIDVELPEVEAGDGSKVTVLDVTFLEGQTIRPISGQHGQETPITLLCRINFSSPKPVSFTKAIKFVDSNGNSFSVPVTATADNCLLTAYPFVAQHRMDFQIVTEQGRTLPGNQSESKDSLNGGGEAVFIAVESPVRPPGTHTSSSTSSRFGVTSSTYEESEAVTESTYPSTPRDGAVNRATRGQESQVTHHDHAGDIATRSLGSAVFPNEETEEGVFHHEVLTAVQRWITLHGWPGGPFPVLVPDGLRSGVSKGSAADAAQDKSSKTPATNNQKKNYTKTIYDLLAHLSGRPVPGIPVNQALPSDPTERVRQLHWQHTTMMTFLRTQGASISHIKPEFLFEPPDYYRWVLVLARVTPRQYKNLPTAGGVPLPSINPDPLCSNIYCVGERILLSWLNHHYENQRHKIWCNAQKGGVPASRWVVNFDYDLLDGLVLGAILAAHVPFLINTHLVGMYTHPSTAEQCLHNALKVVTAFRYIGLDYDIQAIDITDPNPVSLLMLCVHLYQRLPQYTPKTTVEFVGTLHETVIRQVQLSNPSNKPLVYHAIIAGQDARDFDLPKGGIVTIPPKTKHDLKVNFTSRFLRPAQAVLVLVGRRAGAATGTTLVFNLRTVIDNITPDGLIQCESPCYQLKRVDLEIFNPFKESGEFKIVLAETVSLTDGGGSNGPTKKNSVKRIRSKVDHGQRKVKVPSPTVAEEVSTDLDVVANKGSSSQVTAFYVECKSVHLEAEAGSIISVDFLPFHLGKFQCSVLLINEEVGEFIYGIDATSLLPIPSALPYVPSRHSMRISSGAAAGTGRGMFGGDEQIIYWTCESNTVLKEELIVPATNIAKERALVIAAQKGMSTVELLRRHVTDTLTSSTVTAAVRS